MNIAQVIDASAFFSAGICMGTGAVGAAIGEGYAAGSAVNSISVQPKASGEILKTMLVSMAIAESASIFALVVSILLLFQDFTKGNLYTAVALLSSGISMGIGAFGAGVGSGFPGGTACIGIARNPRAAGSISTNMLVGQAVAQTPAIFAMLVSFILMYKSYMPVITITYMCAILGAGISMGFGAIGPGIGGGLAAASAAEGVSKNPEVSNVLTRIMLIGQAVSQSTSVYALVISFVLLFVVK
jgi:ATP synthase F0 subunit c